ncbi:type 1 fimbrial protein [Acinetobacter sp. B5B]|uniref:fimbrial protein n=1 Tax=Acinetobacter baretiae TaxID=2605383 RepID=UPI0018C1F3D4|nr:fimbrial protein [Acinetobacter baretiae]MBF7683554.1 type 1 fimbrial protein [Acinetobacter baretiae]MBF7686131.1 type 1 fimbrial protein [Acinetobacter baretiae]
MKKIALALVAVVATITATHASDGTITITGSVTDKTCNIATAAGKNFTVALPTVSKQTLANAGDVAGRTPFTINLDNCSEGKVATYFEPGANVDFNSGRLNNKNGSARNVQVQLLGSNNGFLPILATNPTVSGSQTNSQWVDVANGKADLNYYAEYYATNAVTAGSVSTSVQYTIIYQ